jgi:transcriptional repressor NrdR
VLKQLRSVDEVAYLRFASVYKNFDAAADFHRELELMEKAEHVESAQV